MVDNVCTKFSILGQFRYLCENVREALSSLEVQFLNFSFNKFFTNVFFSSLLPLHAFVGIADHLGIEFMGKCLGLFPPFFNFLA